MTTWELREGDCMALLDGLESDSVDALVTDPPAGISFMGKTWDHDHGGRAGWVELMAAIFGQCARVMKPGAHGLVWALPRTSHWTATALEDAELEVRDVIVHLYGSGFPKNLDVARAIDKAQGTEGSWEQVEHPTRAGRRTRPGEVFGQSDHRNEENPDGLRQLYQPASELAQAWAGWGTALKPASEHWILVRKPLGEKSVAANVAKWGTGALNIDGGRIPFADEDDERESKTKNQHGDFGSAQGGNHVYGDYSTTPRKNYDPTGRWPANVTLDEVAAAMLGEPSRFFYTAKADRSERNVGLHGFEERDLLWSSGTQSPGTFQSEGTRKRARNFHPTVKPVALMQWLCRLVTPPAGLVLDPFAGSGSTGMGALREGFSFLGMELDPQYVAIARARIEGDAPLFNVEVAR